MMRFGCAMLVAALVSAGASAMDLKWGPELRIGFASMTDDLEEVAGDAKLGIGGGVVVDLGFSDTLALRTGLLYVAKGGQGTWSDGGPAYDSTVTADYLEIPILARFSLAQGKAYAVAGLAVDIETKLEIEVEDMGTGEPDGADTPLALVIGGGVSFKAGSGTISAGIDYSLGLTNLPEDGQDAKANCLSIVCSYTF